MKLFRTGKGLQLFASLSLLFLISCSKDNKDPETTEPDSKDKIVYYQSNSQDLIATYENSEHNLQYYFYGKFNSNGTPDSLRSINLRIRNSDTLLHYVLNDSARIEYMYASTKGVNDTTLFRFTYATHDPTIVSLVLYKMDWTTKRKTFKNSVVFKISGTGSTVTNTYSIQPKVQEANPVYLEELAGIQGVEGVTDAKDLVNNNATALIAFANQLVISGINALPGTVCGAPCAIICGAAGTKMALKPAGTNDVVQGAVVPLSAQQPAKPALNQPLAASYTKNELLTMHGWKFKKMISNGTIITGGANPALVNFLPDGNMSDASGCGCYLATNTRWRWLTNGKLYIDHGMLTPAGQEVWEAFDVATLTEDLLILYGNDYKGTEIYVAP